MADQLVRARPAEATFRYWRAHALLHLDNAVEAYQEAAVAADLDENLYQAHLLMAGAAVKLGRTTDARKAFERAVAASDREPGIMADYASYLASEGGARLAEQAAIQAIQADGRSSNAWAALGLAQYRQKRYEQARASYERAIRLDGQNTWAKMNLAILCKTLGQNDRADALVRLIEDDPTAQDVIGAALAQERQDDMEPAERAAAEDRPTVIHVRRVGSAGLGWKLAIAGAMTAVAVVGAFLLVVSTLLAAFLIALPVLLGVGLAARIWWLWRVGRKQP
jgi:Tfp pilus assembly protein PilF